MCVRALLSVGVGVWFIGRALGDCPLPPHPSHGRYVPQEGDCRGASRPPACEGGPGTLAPEEWLLTVRCDPGYRLQDPDTADVPSVCAGGRWSRPQLACIIPDLLKNDRERCVLPQLPFHGRYTLLAEECGGETFPPGTLVPHDCIIMYSCDAGYRLSGGDEDVLSHCTNKTWNPPLTENACEQKADFNQFPSAQPRTTTSESLTECILPEASSSRRFCSLDAGCEDCDAYNRRCFLPPGSKVRDKVRVVCEPGYSLRTAQDSGVAVCLGGGSWYPRMPECLKQCRPLVSDSLLLRCWQGPDTVDCSKPSLPGTTASFQCLPSYSEFPDLATSGIYKTIITCKSSGRWSNENLPFCKPECGVSKEVGTFSSTIVNGTEAHVGAFPWHAGLYYNKDGDEGTTWENICGGSLISDRVVLTAAHCVVEITSFNQLRIALGKYYRSWDTYERSEVKRTVTAIRYPPEYNRQTYAFDIAVVLLNEKIKFGEFIMPACRVYTAGSDYMKDNSVYIVGWGKTEAGVNSETLLYNEVPIVPPRVCLRKVPSSIFTFEKFCGYKNNSVSVVQKGDSGGGVTAVYNGLHYIVGIVSAKFDPFSMFTNITWATHTTWIESELRNFNNNFR